MRRAQRGVTLLALLAILVLGTAWWIVSGVARPINRAAEDRTQNAAALLQAKAALIGYVAQKAAETGENNPGRLPCPEAPGNIGTANEGVAAGNCTLPAIGRLPWRSLGLDKLRDASGEPLWYVVSPGWALSNSTTPPLTTVINSNTTGQLTLDTPTNGNIVALIIAPGGPLSISASANCAARNQRRTTPSATIDYRDYLECQNANSPADTAFASFGPTDAFNDQVVSITATELLPGIEGAVAMRIESQVIPSLKAVYAASMWGTSTTNPVFPFAAPFANPGPGGVSPSNYQGVAATYAGLMPFNYSSGCSPATDPRCTTTLLSWSTASMARTGGTGTLYGVPNCYADNTYVPPLSICEGYYQNGSVAVAYDDRLAGVAMGLRTFTSADHTVTVYAYNYNTSAWSYPAGTVSRSFNADGSLSFKATTTFPSVGAGNWGYYYVITTRPDFSDHALLSDATANTGWFVRNQWYRLAYYAFAQNHAAGGSGACSDVALTCLQISNVTPSNKQRAILILAGRTLTGSARPNGNIADFLDSAENQNADSRFEQLRISRTFNDRVIVVDANP